ncbi:MAG TPA: hypothetical protein VGQ31_01190 [Candidatus Limnocylindrales bacterium]|jgi:hypothetical protein|nr:hypothetical protein [Candidatus Limnocylindrales bacterium]
MSGESRNARLSRLDPVNWPRGAGILLFVVWLAYALVSTLWVHELLWTVLPAGLGLFLIAERYPWRVVVLVIAPLTLVTVLSQAVAIVPDAPTWAAFAIYLVGCGYFSLVVCSPNRDRVIADLPGWILGERFSSRLSWARFEESVMATNAVVRKINADGRESAGRQALERLAADARHESARGGIWREAWAAHAAWVDGLGELVGTEPTPETLRRVNALLAESNRVQVLAMERTDQAGEPISD